MSQPAPSAFLNNPPPDGSQVEQRLNQLNRALQIGAITVQEHVAERTAILDALLPAQPRQRAVPPPAPQGLMDAARQIARIEDLQDMKLVTPDEFKRERDAIEAAIVEPAKGNVVTLNSGEPVRRVATGESRPVQSEAARAAVLGSLETVSGVVIFGEDTPINLIEAIKPDILVKGADYTIDKVVGADIVQSYGGKVVLANLEDGFSTTSTIARMNESNS